MRGGIILRTILSPIALAALLVVAPVGAADEIHHYDDPAGDESALFGLGRFWDEIFAFEVDCAARAADVLALDLATIEANLTLSLTMDALDDLDARCSYLSLEGAHARYGVTLAQPSTDPAALYAPFELRADARTTGFGLEACIAVLYDDSGASDCLGSFERFGSTLIWRVPLEGEVTVEVYDEPLFGLVSHEETRGYDLRGLVFDVYANANVALEGSTGLAGVRDGMSVDGFEI